MNIDIHSPEGARRYPASLFAMSAPYRRIYDVFQSIDTLTNLRTCGVTSNCGAYCETNSQSSSRPTDVKSEIIHRLIWSISEGDRKPCSQTQGPPKPSTFLIAHPTSHTPHSSKRSINKHHTNNPTTHKQTDTTRIHRRSHLHSHNISSLHNTRLAQPDNSAEAGTIAISLQWIYSRRVLRWSDVL